MAKRTRRLRQQARRNRKKEPPGAALLPSASGECVYCKRNIFSRGAFEPSIYLLQVPPRPPSHHTRGFARIHALIVEVTLVILLVLGCCTVVIPKMRSLFEEWQKWQTAATSPYRR